MELRDREVSCVLGLETRTRVGDWTEVKVPGSLDA